MATVSLKNIYKIYPNNIIAVNDFNLEINDKEFIVFVGPSGCGKSTTLRMIAGLEEISKGTLEIDGVFANNIAPKDRDIAMVFQNYALYPHMSVYENMSFGLKLHKFRKEEIEHRVLETAKTLNIEHLLSKKPRELSGGQRQRVSLGRAIVRDPKVFLLDEPLSNLDAKLRAQMRTEIAKLHHRLETTFIYVTHDQTEAMTMADRIVVMKDGLIQQIDTPQNIYKNPCNKFVAGFIGSPRMNFFNGIINNTGKDLTIKFNQIDLPVPKDRLSSLSDLGRKNICFGIRPEHIKIDNENSINAIPAVVSVVEAMGAESYIYMSSGESSFIVRVDPEIHPKPGDRLKVVFPESKMYLFDMISENII